MLGTKIAPPNRSARFLLHSSWIPQALDLSENKLDTVSAQSLCVFLKSPTCRLREIRLAKADVDDGETAIVMAVSRRNCDVTDG